MHQKVRVEQATCSTVLSLCGGKFLIDSDKFSKMSGTQSLDLLLDLYQRSKAKGEWASLLMETRNGKDVITFRIGSAPTDFSAGSGTPASYPKKKTSSQCRRDQRRKEEFLAKKNLEAKRTSLKKHPAISSD